MFASITRRCARLLLLASVLLASVPAKAQTVSLDFETIGQLTNSFLFLGNNSTSPITSTVYGELAGSGAGGGRGVDLVGSGDNTAVFTNQSFSFRPGQFLGASMKFKLKTATASGRALSFGIVNTTNNVPGSLTDFGSVYFTSVRLNTLGANANLQLEHQHRQTELAAANSYPVLNNSGQATNTTYNNRWYRMSAVFFNSSTNTTSSTNSHRYSVAVQDYGTDGVTPGPVVYTANLISSGTAINNTNLANSTNVFFAFRGADSAGGNVYDDLRIYTNAIAPVIERQPASSTNIIAGTRITLSAGIDVGAVMPGVQWQSNGVAITGATLPTLTTSPLGLSANGAQFRLVVSNAFGSVTSAVCTVSVSGSSVAPSLVSAGAIEPTTVGVAFSGPIDPAQAGMPGNYVVTSAGFVHAVSNATVRADGQTVVLKLYSPLSGGAFSVAVNNIGDQSGNPLDGPTTVNGTVVPLTAFDVGGPAAAGSTLAFGNGYFEQTAGGSDLWNATDSGHLALMPVDGDFDIAMQLAEFRMPDEGLNIPRQSGPMFAKAGIMVRESANAGSRSLQIVAMPQSVVVHGAGNRVEHAIRTNTVATMFKFLGDRSSLAYPRVWMRIKRVNNSFSLYYSTNGSGWALSGRTNFALPSTVLVGPASTVHWNQAGLTSTAVIQNFGGFAPSGLSLSLDSDITSTNLGVSPDVLSVGQVTSFSVAASYAGTTNLAELAYLWQRYDPANAVWTNVPYANAFTNVLVTTPLVQEDSGARFRCVVSVSGETPVSSSEAILGTIAGTTPPVLTSVTRPIGAPNRLLLRFSEPLSLGSLSTGNFTVTNGSGTPFTVTSASFFGNNSTVLLTLASDLPGNGSIGVVGVQDLAGVPNTIATTVSNFVATATGAVVSEYFNFVAGSSPADLTNSAKFLANAPDTVVTSNLLAHSFPAIVNTADLFGIRSSTLFTAPTNGIYRFHVRGDDGMQLWMNTNATASADPAGKSQLLSQNSYPGFANIYTNTGNLVSAPVTLNEGQSYYLEMLFKENASGDGFGVAFSASASGTVPFTTNVLATTNLVNPALGLLPFLTPLSGTAAIDVTPSGPLVLAEGSFLNLAATNVSGAAPHFMQWLRNGRPIPGAVRGLLSQRVYATNSGDQFSVVLGNQFSSATSAVVSVTVTPDTTAPTIIGITARDEGSLVVEFSEPLEPLSASQVANYTLTNNVGANVPVVGAVPDPSGQFVTLYTAAMNAGTLHTLTVGAVTDLAGPGNAVNSSAAFTTTVVSPGFVRVEVFTNITGGSVANLRSSVKFQKNQPDWIYYTNSLRYTNLFGAPSTFDNYGLRFSGYFIPTNSGVHTFYMESDDGAELWLSPDTLKANAVLAIQHVGNTRNFSDARSYSVSLVAGASYYFEVLFKEGTGDDFFRVAVRAPGNNVALGSLAPVGSQSLGSYASLDGLGLAFTTSPANTEVAEYGTAVFTAVAAGTPVDYSGNLFYSWQTNGVTIPGITNGSLTLQNVSGGINGLEVRARAFVPGTNLLSAAATLTVIPDSVAPSATNAAFAGINRIVLSLDEAATELSSTNPANYVVTNSVGAVLPVLSAKRAAAGNRVILTTALPVSGGSYTVVATGLVDLAFSPNTQASPSVLPANAWVASRGFLYAEAFTNITGTPVANLTAAQKFADLLPDATGTLTNFNVNSTNLIGAPTDNFGARVSGFFIPPTNGHYTFHLRSDDASQLFMNTNAVDSAEPAGAVLIAREDSCCKGYGDATAGGPRFISVSNMVAGQRYYMEGLLKDGSVNDYLMVNVVAAGAATPANSTSMDRRFFETYAPPATGSLAFAVSPSMPSVNSGATANFTGSATNAPSSLDAVVFYQWTTNGVAVPGAHAGSFTSQSVTVANTSVGYRLIASVPGLSITSAVVTVNLNPVAVADSITTDSNTVLVVFAPKLALNDSDPDGDTVSFAGASGTSTAGGSVVLNGSVISYTPPVDFTGPDGFSYTLNDSRGGTTTGSVLLSVGPAPGLSLNLASVRLQAGQPRVTFYGIPGRTYYVQTAPDIGGPWTTAAALAADSKGRIIFLDTEDPLPPQRFYRTSTTP